MTFSKKKYSTLFLDRDGVINVRLIDDYIKTPSDFVFIDGVQKAIASLNNFFQFTVVVTNQQGIGKKLMSLEDLKSVHNKMIKGVAEVGGEINSVFFSPALKRENSVTRKPNVGMGLQAKQQFPEIDFKNSIMVGDSLTDLEFGKRLGMKTVLVAADKKTISANDHLIDYAYDSLPDFAREFVDSQK